jgi:sugar lactone lactonase YvrE
LPPTERESRAGKQTSGIAGDGQLARGAPLGQVNGLVVAPDGNLYLSANDRVVRLESNGTLHTVAGTGDVGDRGDGGPASGALMNGPTALAAGPQGTVYVIDAHNGRVRAIGSDGVIRPFAGTGRQPSPGPASDARLDGPRSIVAAADGSLYFADQGNNMVRKLDARGILSTIAGSGDQGSSGDGGAAVTATVDWPAALAIAPDGSLWLASGANPIRRIAADGSISTRGGAGPPSGLAFDSLGQLFVSTLSRDRFDESSSLIQLAADGTPTVVLSARLDASTAPPLDAPAEVLHEPGGLAAAPGGALLIADTGHNRILRRTASGSVTIVAGTGEGGTSGDGGPATNARLEHPQGVAVGPDGTWFIADTGSNQIRRVSAAGTISTVAGSGDSGPLGEGGPALAAQLNHPTSVALGPDGSLFVTDTGNNRICRISP